MPRVMERQAYLAKPHSFCAGCGHGIVNRLLAEILAEKGLLDNNCVVLGVGCCCNVSAYWGGDVLQTAHGRASDTARGLKLALPDVLVTTYQGDGDAYVIGLADTLNAAYVNANITMLVVNNNNFAMTGGQMSWTTLPGQRTTTSVSGRDISVSGAPMLVPEMIVSSCKDVAYVARCSTHSPAEINKTKKSIAAAIDSQLKGEGFSLVEILCQCPTNWGMSLKDSLGWINDSVTTHYPLGELKKRGKTDGA